MNGYRLIANAAVLLAVSATARPDEEPTIWKQIEKEAKLIAEEGEKQDYQTTQAKFDAAARKIADRRAPGLSASRRCQEAVGEDCRERLRESAVCPLGIENSDADCSQRNKR